MTSASSAAPLTNWKIDQLDDLAGKQYLITGANAGIGYEAAAHLRQANADVEAAGSAVMSGSAHPGYSAINLQSTGPTGFFRLLYKLSNPLTAQRAPDGAVSEVLAAAGIEARNGAYYGPTKSGDTRGPVGDSRTSDAAKNEEAAILLWSMSEELLDISWGIS